MTKTASRNSTGFSWTTELTSGFQVFLIALPLCLGISLASGFPPMAGIVAAIVGGLIVSRISGSHVTINGPAAGLIVVILDGVDKLGAGDPIKGYALTLAAIFIAGILEILLGLAKIGKYCRLIPSTVVHGMLAGIGIIIIIKQLPVLLGLSLPAGGIISQAMAIPTHLAESHPIVALIGISSLGLLIILNLVKSPLARKVPPALVVVLFAAVTASLLTLGGNGEYVFGSSVYAQGQNFFVPLPEKLNEGLAFPDFSSLMQLDFWIVVLTITIVASIESLLSAKAVDKLDPEQRKTNLNKDLVAVGVGTSLSALLGGLPMIAEIVRSSANISHGARSGWSNFFHGLFLLIAVLLIPFAIRMIPLTALAALLVFTGYRLASPFEFRKMKDLGFDQLIVFITTIFLVVSTDLLIGVAGGILLKALLHLVRNGRPHEFLKSRVLLRVESDKYVLEVSGALVFSNLSQISDMIDEIPRNAHVLIDFNQATFVDHTAMSALQSYRQEFQSGGGSMSWIEPKAKISSSSHPLASRSYAVSGTASGEQ